MRLVFLACCFLLVGEIAVFADDSHNAGSFREKCVDSFSGKAIVEGRKDGSYPAGFSVGSSMGHCLGVLRTVMSLGPLLAPEFKFCPPDDTPPIVGLNAISVYLNAHPNRLNDDELIVIMRAFEQRWPCK